LPEIRYVREMPPPHLVVRVALPERQGDTIGEVIEWIVPIAGALESCNMQLEALKQWGSGVGTGNLK